MAITQVVTCDVCGKPKQEVNHWFRAQECKGMLYLRPWGVKSKAGDLHLCGQECAIKAVSQWMQEHAGETAANAKG